MNTLQAMNVSLGEHPEGKIDLLKLPPPVRAALIHAAGVHLGPDLWAKEATEGVFDLSLPWVRETIKIVLATCPRSWIPGGGTIPQEPLDPSEGLMWESGVHVSSIGKSLRIVWQITSVVAGEDARPTRHISWAQPFLPEVSQKAMTFPYDKGAPLTIRILRYVILTLRPPEGDTWDPAGGWVSWDRLG